jgi:uncharacterized protein
VNVAIIGASNDRSKFGNKAVRSYRAHGHRVFPVNLHEEKIEGEPVYRSIRDIPADLDATLVYVPPQTTLTLLDEIASKGPGQLYLNPGSENAAVIERAADLGLEPILACSIVAIGDSPSRYG